MAGDQPERGPHARHRARPARSREPDAEPVLPEVAAEDRDESWGDERDSGRRDDDWYRRERPPHHE